MEGEEGDKLTTGEVEGNGGKEVKAEEKELA